MYGDALTTKERIKDRLKLTKDTWDDLIDSLILGVTARIEQFCGRRFVYGTYTNEKHDGSDFYGSKRFNLILKNAPVQVVSSIEYNAGTNSDPDWVTMDVDDYDVDLQAGLITTHFPLPCGKQNVRVTYTGGYSGFSLGISNTWHFNITPSGTVNGVNLTFTLPEDAEQIIVFADGLREKASNITFTPGTDTFTFAADRAPGNTLAVDYLATVAVEDADYNLPQDLVMVAEAIIVKAFKRRDADGKQSESFGESSVTYFENLFSNEDLRTIRNYRRGYNI